MSYICWAVSPPGQHGGPPTSLIPISMCGAEEMPTLAAADLGDRLTGEHVRADRHQRRQRRGRSRCSGPCTDRCRPS